MRFETLLSLLLFIAASAVTTTTAAADPNAADLLKRSYQAMGGEHWDGITTLMTRYSVTTSGLEGSAISVEDLQSGRFLNQYDLGAFKGAEGYDGEQPWSMDPNGAVTISETVDEVEYAHNAAFRLMRAYWYPERQASAATWDRRETLDGADYDVLIVTPEGVRPFELWIDSSSGLIGRTVERLAIDTETTIFSDYRETDGVMIAHHVLTTTGDARYDTIAKVEEVTINPPLPATVFDVPEESTSEIEMIGDSTEIPFRLINNHIFIEAKLNGQGPFTLLVDTGGANVIVPAAMQRLGIAGAGAIQGRGTGEDSVDISIARIDSVTLGGMTMSDQTFYGIDMTDISKAGGIAFDGLVGYEVFKRFAVEIDYQNGKLTLTRPEKFQYQGDAQPIPFIFDGQTPQVDGSIDGFEGTFTLDTGSRSSLDIMGPFAERNDFDSHYDLPVEAIAGWGVGGPGRSKIGRAKSLKLGPVEVRDIILEVSLQKDGAFSDRYRAGNVGGGVLKRFTVTFDYANQLMWLEPNDWYSEPDRYDRSGMWINLADNGFEIIDVVTAGPAAGAGLQGGDIITAIGGKPAGDWTLYGLRQALREQSPGTTLEVGYLRGDAGYETELELRELVP